MTKTTQHSIPWFFIIAIHVIVGPILMVVLNGIIYEFPNIGEALLGILGFFYLVVPVVVAMIFGFVPFLLLAVLCGKLFQRNVTLPNQVLIVLGAGALSGYIWPVLFASGMTVSSTLSMIFSGALAALCCYRFSLNHVVKKRSQIEN